MQMRLTAFPLHLGASSAIALALAAAGCSAGTGSIPGSAAGAGGAATAPGAGGDGPIFNPPSTATGSPGGAPTITPIDPATGADNGDACKAVVQQAEKQTGRADIVFVLDNSGSMAQEVSAVQSNLNSFSTQIEASGIDVHVVVISAPPGGG